MKHNTFVSFMYKTGRRAKGASALKNYRYICRLGKGNTEKIDLVTTFHGNFPKCVGDNPQLFWEASDLYERANGRVFTEMTVGLPRELTMEESLRLVRDFIKTEMGVFHAYSVAVHNPMALDGQSNPHAHIMLSERKNDGIERDLSEYFQRGNTRNPERGGASKDPDWNRRDKVAELRHSWCNHLNLAFERNGIEKRVDARSLKEQGIEREAEPKLGVTQASLLRAGIITDKAIRVVELRALRRNQQYKHISGSIVLKAVKQRKLSIYKELELNERAQFGVGGYRERTSKKILFQPTKDSFLIKRREDLVSDYQQLSADLSRLKKYERELLLIGEGSLEFKPNSDLTEKSSLVYPEILDLVVRTDKKNELDSKHQLLLEPNSD